MNLFLMRVAIFVISLLLVTDAVAPDTGWFIALAVLSGLSMVGFGGWRPLVYFGGRGRRWRWLDD